MAANSSTLLAHSDRRSLAELVRVLPNNSAELVFREPVRLSQTIDNELQALLAHAFQTHQVERITAFVDSSESAALRLLNRAHFQFQRTQWSNPSREPFQITMVYELTRERWSDCRKAEARTGLGLALRSLGARLRWHSRPWSVVSPQRHESAANPELGFARSKAVGHTQHRHIA
jgi:hypothetical protein